MWMLDSLRISGGQDTARYVDKLGKRRYFKDTVSIRQKIKDKIV
jgi:hypothetical protein